VPAVLISICMILDAKRIGRFAAGHFPTRSVSDGGEGRGRFARRDSTSLGHCRHALKLRILAGIDWNT